ncbi:MAG TPA: hypothetical protein VM053_11965 [Gemmatimonadaceae bacterium]|nr:hypothetical protein [Gemmatimonadaceae bacterium]
MARLIFPLKLFLMASTFIAVIAIVIGSPTRIVADWSAPAVIGAQSSLAVLLIPNVLTFMVFALLAKRHWVSLRIPQILVVSFICAVITVALMLAIGFLFSPLLGTSQVAALAAILAMLIPGILAAQILKFRTMSDPVPAPPNTR